MKYLNNYIKLAIPTLRLDVTVDDNAALIAALDKATQQIGGASVTTGAGAWFKGDEEVIESITYVQWNFGNNIIEIAKALTGEVVDEMFALGEEEVFRERQYHVSAVGSHNSVGYRAGILYAPTRH